jgi:acetolactate synthase I/III small subunit
MKHTLVALVENEPGVLNRVASLFRRRNFNIDSLTVGRTEDPNVSRMTIVLDSNVANAYLVEKNLIKLVNVIRVDDVTQKEFFSRDLALVKVKGDLQVKAIAERYGAKVIDDSSGMMLVEISDNEQRVEEAIEALRPLGIVELVRTGVVAMGKGDHILQTDPEALSV